MAVEQVEVEDLVAAVPRAEDLVEVEEQVGHLAEAMVEGLAVVEELVVVEAKAEGLVVVEVVGWVEGLVEAKVVDLVEEMVVVVPKAEDLVGVEEKAGHLVEAMVEGLVEVGEMAAH